MSRGPMSWRAPVWGSALALAAALLALATTSATARTKAPLARAAVASYCRDTALAQPTQVHAGPYSTSPTVKSYNHDDTVKGNCFFYNNYRESHWYMEVNYGGTRPGYIWVQRLYYGSSHRCMITNASGGFLAIEPIGYNSDCDLINYP